MIAVFLLTGLALALLVFDARAVLVLDGPSIGVVVGIAFVKLESTVRARAVFMIIVSR